jgi:hypothetical protein
MFFKDQVSAMWTPVAGLHVEKDLAPLNWDIVSYPTMNGFGPQPYPVFMFLNVGSKYKEVMGLFVHRDVSDGKGEGGDVHPGAEQR